MDAVYFRTLYDYNYWARDRILGAAAGVSKDEYTRPNGFTYGSLRGILVHTLSGEWVWRSRCQDGINPTTHLSEDGLPTLDSLARRWAEEEAKMRRFLAELAGERLRSYLDYQSFAGKPYTNTLWQVMAHLVNHGTHHRSEAAEALTMLGHSPGDTDMIEYFRGVPAG